MITNAQSLTMQMFLAYNCNWHASPVQADAFCISSVCTAYGPGTSQLTGTGVSVVLYFTAIVCPS